MNQHLSAGAVLFNKTKDKVFLIYKKERNEWLLPKGHKEENGKLIDTAIREVKEETGYQNLEIINSKPINIIEFDFELKKEPNHKIVYYFCFKLKDNKRSDNSEEGGNCFSTQEAIKKVKYDNEKETIKKAVDLLN